MKHRGRNTKAHRLSFEMAHGPIPDGLCVLHHCDNPPCVNPDHLYLGNHADNANDRVRRDRQPRGEASATARLTEGDVMAILTLSAAGKPRREVAALYGIDPGHVNHIVKGRRWAHLSAVTSGHGECCCSECETGWAAAWETWAAERRGVAAVIDADEFQEVQSSPEFHAFVSAAEEYVAETERQIEYMRARRYKR